MSKIKIKKKFNQKQTISQKQKTINYKRNLKRRIITIIPIGEIDNLKLIIKVEVGVEV